MKLSQTELKALHKLSFGNEIRIKNSIQAGCFACLEVFPTSAIYWWLPDKPIQTAMCPHCEIDAVLADDENVKLSDDLLKQMQIRYFCPESEVRETRYFNSFSEAKAAYHAAQEKGDTTGIVFGVRLKGDPN
jgi:hypothetical protein